MSLRAALSSERPASVHIEARAAGTYSLVILKGSEARLHRSGIPTHEEARTRAEAIARLCGYTIRDKTRTRARVPA